VKTLNTLLELPPNFQSMSISRFTISVWSNAPRHIAVWLVCHYQQMFTIWNWLLNNIITAQTRPPQFEISCSI